MSIPNNNNKGVVKLRDAIKEVVLFRNFHKAGRIADILRFRKGLNHQQIYEMFERLTGISKPDFEELMYEADYYS